MNETVIVAINRLPADKTVSVPAGAIEIRRGSRLVPLLGKGREQPNIHSGLQFTIPPGTAVAYAVK